MVKDELFSASYESYEAITQGHTNRTNPEFGASKPGWSKLTGLSLFIQEKVFKTILPDPDMCHYMLLDTIYCGAIWYYFP